MTAFRFPMPRHSGLVAGTMLSAAALIGSVPAGAQSAAYYTATLAAPAPSARTVAGSLVWTCAGVNCNAPRGNSRPAIVCARLVRALGAVETFSADNQPLDAGQLQRCNASA